MKKNAIWYALMLTVCLTMLTGCMNSDNQPELTPSAEPSPAATMNSDADNDNTVLGEDSAITATAAPGQQGSASDTFDWTTNAGDIENRINQISEISESRLVVNDNTALVAVKFASSYQGELTERIREMVAAVIMEADPSVTTVAVTAEEADVNSVAGIADKISAGTALEELKDEIDRIIRNATTMR